MIARRIWRTRGGLILRMIEAGDGKPFQLVSYRPDSEAEMGCRWPELVANGDC
jgi:hypothetical protein